MKSKHTALLVTLLLLLVPFPIIAQEEILLRADIEHNVLATGFNKLTNH